MNVHLNLASLTFWLIGFVLVAGSGCSRRPDTVEDTPPEPSARSEPIPLPLPEVHDDVVNSGTEVCARCGAKREVRERASGVREFDVGLTEEQRWAEARIGACAEHLWQHTGCWFRRTRRLGQVSCSMLEETHVLWRSLAKLDGEPADQLARRFAALPAERQIELWRGSNRRKYPEESEKMVARAVALEAGWDDLAASWTD